MGCRRHPNYFTHTITATNYYNAFIGNRRYYEEQINSAFFMATTNVGKAILRAGVRWEDTSTDSTEFDPRTPAELAAAGIPEVNGRATTIPGLEYQYFSKPKIHRTGGYDNLFPSAALKYKFNQNFDLHLGYSSTIRRPTFRDVSGVWIINDEALTVTAPNPNLKPETSDNLSARLAYYFKPVGILALNFFQNNVEGLFITERQTADEFGNDDPNLAGYEFVTTGQSQNEFIVRGMEFEYSQSLSFLPGALKGLNIRASYTRNYAEILTVNMVPHSINAGVSYSYRRFNAYTNMNWRDNYPNNTTGTRFWRHRANLDIGGGYRLSQRTSIFVSARNIFNEPYLIMEKVGANPAVSQFYEVNGTNWTFGVKSVW